MDVVAIAGLAGFVLLKEIGVPLPVPGDLLIIGAGATLAGDLPGRASSWPRSSLPGSSTQASSSSCSARPCGVPWWQP